MFSYYLYHTDKWNLSVYTFDLLFRVHYAHNYNYNNSSYGNIWSQSTDHTHQLYYDDLCTWSDYRLPSANKPNITYSKRPWGLQSTPQHQSFSTNKIEEVNTVWNDTDHFRVAHYLSRPQRVMLRAYWMLSYRTPAKHVCGRNGENVTASARGTT